MLDERKKHILRAIVDDYISTAEPIGSRTIAKKYRLGVSPATIRNEMADLEALGYITHLYASSGRIPSSKGYRFYVDDLLTLEQMPETEISLIDDLYESNINSLEDVFRETARIVSQLTKNISMVLAPKSIKTRFTYVRFISLSENKVIAVLMTNGGFAENKVLDIPPNTDFKAFEDIADMINIFLAKCDYNRKAIEDFAKVYRTEINTEVLKMVTDLMDAALITEQQRCLYYGGARQLMEQPEFHDVDRVKEILGMLEEEDLLCNMLQKQRNRDLSVLIGQENQYLPMQDCSIISATYHIDSQPVATLAVLGPTRMDYGKTISLLNYMNNKLGSVVHSVQR